MSRTVTVIPGPMRPLVEDRLPDWVEPRYFRSREEAIDLAPQAEIGWLDMKDKQGMAAAMTAATQLKWLHSTYTGLDGMPLETLRGRGTIVTNGAGLNAITIAEYVVMGMLTIAKGYRDVVRAQDRHEWLTDSPGKAELFESKALLLGYGAIGKRIEERLKGFAVDVTVVRRTPGPGTLTPDQWRARLGDFDWVILAVPATPETDGMIGTAELAAMKPSATLINIARGTLVDQDALVAALRERRIASAFLDVTTPEPLPADHPLWSLDNAHLTMHLSGRAQDTIFIRSAERFLENLDRWHKGEAVQPQIDLSRGY